MPQATITVRIQAAGKDETFAKTLSQQRTDNLLSGLLRNDSPELQEEFPVLADRLIELYKGYIIQMHNDLMNADQRRLQTVTDGWTP